MWRRSSRKCTVMPLAPPRCASTAAHTGSGSYVRRACRSVATWSILTPSSIIVAVVFGFFHRLQIAHDPATHDRALLQIVVQHFAHEPFGFCRRFRRTEVLLREREERRAAHLRIPLTRLSNSQARTTIERVIVPLRRIDRPSRVRLMRERQRVTELGEQLQLEASQRRRLFRAPSELAERRFVIAI